MSAKLFHRVMNTTPDGCPTLGVIGRPMSFGLLQVDPDCGKAGHGILDQTLNVIDYERMEAVRLVQGRPALPEETPEILLGVQRSRIEIHDGQILKYIM